MTVEQQICWQMIFSASLAAREQVVEVVVNWQLFANFNNHQKCMFEPDDHVEADMRPLYAGITLEATTLEKVSLWIYGAACWQLGDPIRVTIIKRAHKEKVIGANKFHITNNLMMTIVILGRGHRHCLSCWSCDITSITIPPGMCTLQQWRWDWQWKRKAYILLGMSGSVTQYS